MPSSAPAGERRAKIANFLLAGLLGAVAFALACYEITDRDVWWQLRSGQWIIEHGRVPALDPFSYGSADREWIDLHWLFQIVLAAAYRLAGLPGTVLMAGACAASSVLAAFAATARNRPLAACVAGWLPALALIGWRLPPRPELFSLAFLACDLALLEFGRRRPKLLLCLPVVQLLWVNSHGLFVLGPAIIGFDFLERTMLRFNHRRRAANPGPVNAHDAGRAWKIAGLSLVLAIAACLANPYAMRGALFPWQLLPKIASEENLYKQSVAEFRSPTTALRAYQGGIVPGGWYLGLEYLLLGLLPVSFVLPAVRRSWRQTAAEKSKRRDASRRRPSLGPNWPIIGVLAIALPAASALTLPGSATPAWRLSAGNYLPGGFLLLGIAGGWTLRTSRGTAAMAVCGGAGCALWLCWLRLYFCGSSVAASAAELIPPIGVLTCIVGAANVWLALRNGASLYRLLLAAAFAYLGLQAVRNAPLFGLAAGAVGAWNLGDYLAGETRRLSAARADKGAWAARCVLIGLLIFWLWAIVNDHYYVWLRHSRKFGFHEKPFLSAHDAARFAGRPGMPARAVAFGFEQAGVYLFHNGPQRKPYIDPRLELPGVEVYRTYIELYDGLAENDSHWPAALEQIGNPLVLIGHAENERREAHLLVHPDWRCIYFDAVAAVFVRRDQAAAYPALDFAGRRFRESQPSISELPGAAYHEATALCRIAAELKRFPEPTRSHRMRMLLAARERIDAAFREESGSPRVWALLGDCLAAKIEHLAADDEWLASRDLPWAQAAYAYRRALDAAPGDPEALAGLYHLFAARGLREVQTAVGARLLKTGWASPEQAAEIKRLMRSATVQAQEPQAGGGSPEQRFFEHLRQGRAAAALTVVEQHPDAARRWPVAAQAARLCLLTGLPERARELLEQSAPPTDETSRQSLIADAYAAEQLRNAAAELYREVVTMRPDRSDAWLALATLCAEAGDGAGALAACSSGLDASPAESVRAELQAWQMLLEEHRTVTSHPTDRQ